MDHLGSVLNKCKWCGASGKDVITTMSIFCTDMICMDCKDREVKHPLYPIAREAEANAVKMGDYNFPGIGKPSDL